MKSQAANRGRVDVKVAVLDQLVKIRARFSQIRHRLRELDHRHAAVAEPMRDRLHHVGVETDLADGKAITPLEERRLDGALKIQWIFGARLKDPVAYHAHAARFSVPGHSHKRRGVPFDAGVDTDPHRQRQIRRHRAQLRILAAVRQRGERVGPAQDSLAIYAADAGSDSAGGRPLEVQRPHLPLTARLSASYTGTAIG